MLVMMIDFACSVRLRVCEHKLIKLYAQIISVNPLMHQEEEGVCVSVGGGN